MKRDNVFPPLVGFAFVVAVVLWLAHASHTNLLGHSAYDSYTIEAIAWRHGHVTVENRVWLELAIFHGKFYVSFPPVPAVPLFVLQFFWGENTPSGALCLIYFSGGLAAVYALLRRYLPADQSTLWTVFVALGGTLLSLMVAGGGLTGGVWFQAQLMAFMFTALAFLLMDGKRRRGWWMSLACLALAVGCRPFNAIYFPVLLVMLHGHIGGDRRAWLRLLSPAVAIGVVMGAYNAARFGNPAQFGHKYLPELRNAHESMFGVKHLGTNIDHILQAPKVVKGKLEMPPAGGFGVYLTNPLLLVGLGAILVRRFRRKTDLIDLILFITLVAHALLLLTHRTNGGWQYGTRYLTDLLPPLVFVVARNHVRTRTVGAVTIGALIAFNVLGTAIFNTTQ